MQLKRSRVSCSSSCVETGIVDVLDKTSNAEDQAELQWDRRTAPKIEPSSEEGDQSRPVILRIASPEMVKERFDHVNGGGSFLERCYYCKKQLLEKKEVYMYGVLHAFCSPQCRGKQIMVDMVIWGVSKKRRAAGGSSEVNGAKNQ